MVKKAKKNNAGSPGRIPTGGKSLKISRPSMQQGTSRATGPKMTDTSSGVLIRRSEMVGGITNGNTTGFAVTPASLSSPGYDISPTNGFMFPWLASVAGGYEKFRFRKLSFRAVSGQPSTATGRLYMGADPDWDDDVPLTKPSLMGLSTASNGPCWQELSLSIPVRTFVEGTEWRYCTPSRRVATSEPRLGFLGFLVIGIDTPTANLVWDLWVDYEVELTLPTAENLLPSETTVTTSGIAFAAGTDNLFYNYPRYPNPSGPLSMVSTDLANVTNAYAGVTIPSAIALPQERTGYLELSKTMALAATTPTALLAALSPTQIASIFDGAGNLLGHLNNVTGVQRTIGPKTSGLNGAGNDLVMRTGVFLDDLFKTFGTAKYIVDGVSTVAAFTPTVMSALAKLVL